MSAIIALSTAEARRCLIRRLNRVFLPQHSSSSPSPPLSLPLQPTTAGLSTITRHSQRRAHLIFGANTDVGKTLVSAGLVRASLLSPSMITTTTTTTTMGGGAADDAKNAVAVQYIKPLQCGGSDQAFVEQYLPSNSSNNTTTNLPPLETKNLFLWDTFASPHTASRLENKPIRDKQVLTALQHALQDFWEKYNRRQTTTFIETAGGVLSPSAASPPVVNNDKHPQADNNNCDDKNNPSNWTWTTQGDLYQPLSGFAPAILVGDGRLGGISATLSAMESLILRGYDIAAICMVQSPPHDNASAIREYITTRHQHSLLSLQSGSGERLLEGISSRQAIVEFPPIPADPNVPLHEWYEQTTEQFVQLNTYLHNIWQGQMTDLQSLAVNGQDVLWGNGTQPTESPLLIDNASGQHLHVLRPIGEPALLESRSLFDASGLLDHGSSAMALAAAAAVGRYGPFNGMAFSQQAIHAPAVTLSQKLLAHHQSWATRVWFANDRSRATEAAIRMGIKTYQARQGVPVTDVKKYDWVVCGQEDCYHGDTLGAGNIVEPYADDNPSVQHPWYISKGLCLATPSISYHKGALSIAFPESLQPPQDGKGPTTYEFENMAQAMNVRERRINPRLFSLYKEMIEMQWLVYEHSGLERKIASVILEPLIMLGQGGGVLKLVDPLWQRALVDIAKSRNVPVIYDESVSGMYRISGNNSCREIIQADPDIATYSNLLTGGLLPLSATLTSKEVYEACCCGTNEPFLQSEQFAAYPTGCVVGIQAMEAYSSMLDKKHHNIPDDIPMLFDENMVKDLSKLELVDESFALGTILAVRILSPFDDSDSTSTTHAVQSIVTVLQEQHGILVQNQRNAIYAMVSPLSSTDDCKELSDRLYETIETVGEDIKRLLSYN